MFSIQTKRWLNRGLICVGVLVVVCLAYLSLGKPREFFYAMYMNEKIEKIITPGMSSDQVRDWCISNNYSVPVTQNTYESWGRWDRSWFNEPTYYGTYYIIEFRFDHSDKIIGVYFGRARFPPQ